MTLSSAPRSSGRLALLSIALTIALVTTLVLVAVARRPTSPPVVTFVGDSYTAGSVIDTGYAQRFPNIVGRRLNVQSVVVAEPGAGYVAKGVIGERYAEEVPAIPPESAAVIVYGSRNDVFDGTLTDAVGTAARDLIEQIHRQAPDAQVVVIGPSYAENPLPPGGVAIDAAIRSACKQTGTRYVDALTWMHQMSPGMIGADSIHPTDSGHRWLASKIEPIVREALGD